MKTIAEQLIQLNQIKSDIRQAIISKGVQVAETDGLAVYASKIAAINAILPTISFTISLGGGPYLADEGMTWAEWVNSAYNTDGYVIYANEVRNAERDEYVVLAPNTIVKPSDVIIEQGPYYQEGN